ncbi:ABC transporter substrate-binding protein [Methanosphaerula palustris]|nr:ABC transporter substrate-binding protein [Methanosphaerula palustris]
MKFWYGALTLVILVAVLASAGCTGTTPATNNSTAVKTNATTVVANVTSTTDVTNVTNTTGTGNVTYIVGVDADNKPYTFSDNGTIVGFDVDSIQWIAQQQGFNVKIQPMAWDGIIPALLQKKIDMVYSGMTKTPERAAQVNFSKTYLIVNQSVVGRNDSTLTMDDFKKGKVIVGTQRSSSANSWIDDNLVKNNTLSSDNLKLYDSVSLALADLANKRVDVVMFDQPVMNTLIKDMPLKQIGTVDTHEEYGVAIRKEDTELQNKINTGLDQLMNSPKWQELLKKYNMD